MDFALERTIRHAAFGFAISPDGSKIAVSGARDIIVLSLPDLQRLQSISINNAGSMVFLSDNCSMLILNTTGMTFFWNGTTAEKIGKWPVPRWFEEPLFYGDDNHIFWGSVGGVWCYDIHSRAMTQVFTTKKEAVICRCDQGIVKILLISNHADEQRIGMAEISFDGDILYECRAKHALKTRLVNRPAWSDDDLIAISTIAAPQESFPVLPRVIAYKFTLDGRAMIDEDTETGEAAMPAHSILYLLDKKGNILIENHSGQDDDDGHLYYGNGIFAMSCSSQEKIRLFDAATLRQIYCFQKSNFSADNGINPPTFVCFSPDGKVLTGSWSRLYRFRQVI